MRNVALLLWANSYDRKEFCGANLVQINIVKCFLKLSVSFTLAVDAHISIYNVVCSSMVSQMVLYRNGHTLVCVFSSCAQFPCFILL